MTRPRPRLCHKSRDRDLEVRDRDSRPHRSLMVNKCCNKISGILPNIKIIKIIRNLCKWLNTATFIFTFVLGIYHLKPMALFTNSMKKCIDIENVGSVWRVYIFFIRKMSVNQLNIRRICRCHASINLF